MTQQMTKYEGGELDTMQLGNVLAKSGYFQDARDAAQAIVKVLAGRELGIGPVASMTGIYIVKGRVTLSANLMAAQIKRSGRYTYRVKRMDDTGCEIEFFEDGQSIGISSFTEADARLAGLLGGDNWKKFPRNMYFSRAMSNGAKWYCPDVFSGPVYTPDELSSAPPAYVDTQTGEIVDAPSPRMLSPEVTRTIDRAVDTYRNVAETDRMMQQAENGASYEPPANAKELTRREKLIARIAQLTAEAEVADLEIELAKPVGKMTDDELIQHGKNLSAALAQHAAQDIAPQRAMPEERLPDTLPDVRQKVA